MISVAVRVKEIRMEGIVFCYGITSDYFTISYSIKSKVVHPQCKVNLQTGAWQYVFKDVLRAPLQYGFVLDFLQVTR